MLIVFRGSVVAVGLSMGVAMGREGGPSMATPGKSRTRQMGEVGSASESLVATRLIYFIAGPRRQTRPRSAVRRSRVSPSETRNAVRPTRGATRSDVDASLAGAAISVGTTSLLITISRRLG